VPSDDLGFGNSLADIRQLENVIAQGRLRNQLAIVCRMASATRRGPGK
jgi:hypothetical protein